MLYILSKVWLIIFAGISIIFVFLWTSDIAGMSMGDTVIFKSHRTYFDSLPIAIAHITLWILFFLSIVATVIDVRRRKLFFLNIFLPVTVILFSTITLISLKDQIQWYMPNVYYESFIPKVNFSIYFSFASLIFTSIVVLCYLGYEIFGLTRKNHAQSCWLP